MTTPAINRRHISKISATSETLNNSSLDPSCDKSLTSVVVIISKSFQRKAVYWADHDNQKVRNKMFD